MVIFIKFFNKLLFLLEIVALSVFAFFVHCWMGIIYFRSAFVKLNNWENTVMLFEYEYKTLLLSPAVAAFLSTSVELICPILLFIGLFTRLAVLPMLVVVLVIQYTYLDLKEHYYWVILLSFLLCYGSGYFSCDRIIRNCFIIK